MSYPDEPEGVWGEPTPETILGYHGDMPITRNYQALKLLQDILPGGHMIRKYIFDPLQLLAEKDKSSELYLAGPRLFEVLGLSAEGILTFLGKKKEIGEQYKKGIGYYPHGHSKSLQTNALQLETMLTNA